MIGTFIFTHAFRIILHSFDVWNCHDMSFISLLLDNSQLEFVYGGQQDSNIVSIPHVYGDFFPICSDFLSIICPTSVRGQQNILGYRSNGSARLLKGIDRQLHTWAPQLRREAYF